MGIMTMRYSIFIVLTVFCFVVFGAGAAPTGSWYKGALHLHSLWSDGDAAPEVVASWYKEHGWQFVCFTDHNVIVEGEQFKPIEDGSALSLDRIRELQERFGADSVVLVERLGRKRMRLKTLTELKALFEEPGNFLLMMGEEITSFGGNPHVGAINVVARTGGLASGDHAAILRRYVDAVEQQSVQKGRPIISVLNHPAFSDAITIEEAIACANLRFFEVYNGHPSVNNWGHEKKGYPSTDRYWDVVLSMNLETVPGYFLYGIATDDAHNYYEWGLKQANPGRGWVMVRSEKLEADVLVRALQAGDFYSSTGVILRTMHRGERSLSFEIDAEPGVTYTTRFIGTRKGFDRSSTPLVDDAGNPLPRASRHYSQEIGIVLAETTELTPMYTLGPDDLYVRAVVVSDKLQPNPFRVGDVEMAWLQPVIAR